MQDKLAKIIWEFLTPDQKLEKVDAIIVLGNQDLRTPEWGAKLFKEGFARIFVISGGLGRLTPTNWRKPEAQIFAEVAFNLGIAKDQIIIEDSSTNTKENILNTKKILKEKGIKVKKIIIVSFPMHQLRAVGYFNKLWEDVEVIFSFMPVSFNTYPNKDISKEEMLNLMVGEVLRLQNYPKLGFMPEVNIPKEVIVATNKLLKLGFDKYQQSYSTSLNLRQKAI